MEDPFAPIRPGGASPFMRSFSTVQKSLTLLKDLDRRSSDDQGAAVVKPLRSALRILIENQSGVDLNPGDIVQVNTAVTPFTGDDQYAFRDTPGYTGALPAATVRLGEAAKAAGNAEVERLAETLKVHAKSEEELFYPAALLVGDVVRARSATATSPR